MDVFDLYAKISIDTGEYERGLDSASGKTSGFADKLKSGLAAAAKVGAAAIGAATTALVAFAGASIQTGAQFDSSMAQVAATMGTTVDQVGELRDFAMDMGAKTAFSATQAADALNYMALAGYDADQSMQALPNVLNLAAAGGIELAYASDMVTDAQSALGLSMEESAELVDKMAMASSKSNTSVAQLGEAILTVGGTAKNLAGGTTELSAALGILADNGVKGAEGGTALRNIILSLAAPTDTAAKTMEALGVKVYDAEGKMRPLNETFGDLQTALSTMTQGEQTEVLSTLFNKVDLKSANALLANTGERFNELSGYIDNAAGAAERMASTQLDNLTGDITLFQSALEGAQIVLADQLSPNFREFVQFGTESITHLSEAFQEGGLSGAMTAFGEVLSNGLAMIVGYLPQVIDAGMQLIGALGQGILDNLPVIASSALEIISTLASGLVSALPSIGDAIIQLFQMFQTGIAEHGPELLQNGMQMLQQLASGIEQGLPKVAEVLPQLIIDFVNFISSNLPTILDQGVSIINSLVNGILNAIPVLVSNLPQVITAFVNFIVENLPKILESGVKILKNLIDGIIKMIPELVSNLPQIIQAIVSGIGALMGSIITIGGDIVRGIWDGISGAAGWLWNQITGWMSGIVDGIKGFFGIHSPSKLMRDAVGKWIPAGLAEGIEQNEDTALDAIDDMGRKMLNRSSDWLDENNSLFGEFGSNFEVGSNLGQGAQAVSSLANGISSSLPALNEKLFQVITAFQNLLEESRETIFGIGAEITQNLIDGILETSHRLENIPDITNAVILGVKNRMYSIQGVGGDIVRGIWKGISDNIEWFKNKVMEWLGSVVSEIKIYLGIGSPSKLMRDEVGRWLPAGVAVGIEGNTGAVFQAIDQMGQQIVDRSSSWMDRNNSILSELEEGFGTGYANIPMTTVSGKNGFYSAGNGESGVVINQYIEAVPLTPSELARQSVDAYRRLRWA